MGLYIFPSGYFLSLSGGTVSGDTVFTAGLSANTFSATTIYSGSTNLSDIISSFSGLSGDYLSVSGGTGGEYYFTGNTTADTFFINTEISPTQDDFVDLGTPIRRFRNLNTKNGVAVNFTASTIHLGARVLDEYSIILTGDTIDCGLF